MLKEKRYSFLIGFGSNASENLQDSYDLVQVALSLFADKNLKISRISKFYKTPAFPVGAGPDYINCAVSGTARLNPNLILNTLHQIEDKMGRVRVERWGQRVIDIDLLSCEDFIRPSEEIYLSWKNLELKRQMADTPDQMILPHPRIQDRAFVLVPLSDIAPNWIHPVLKKTSLEMKDALPEELIKEVEEFHPLK